jgi:hypothetical protein
MGKISASMGQCMGRKQNTTAQDIMILPLTCGKLHESGREFFNMFYIKNSMDSCKHTNHDTILLISTQYILLWLDIMNNT